MARTPEQRAVRKAKRAARRAYYKLHPKIRYYRLYALELENGNYYVGMTAQMPERRFIQHFEGHGAQWTKIHKPKRIIEVRYLGRVSENTSARMENAMTIEYMDKYGVQCVRGGGMCTVKSDGLMKVYNRHSIVRTTGYVQLAPRRERLYQERLARELAWTQN